MFGKIENEICELFQPGKIAQNCWADIPKHFKNTELGEYIIMPNHLHGIIFLYDEDTESQRKAFEYVKLKEEIINDEKTIERINKMHKKLSVIIGSFKSAVTKESRRALPEQNFEWQTSFYDHIIRNERGLEYISDYIKMNPLNWNKDLENTQYLSRISITERSKQIHSHYKSLLNM